MTLKIENFDYFSQRCPHFYTHLESENNGYDCKHPDVEIVDEGEKIHRCHVFTCPLVAEAREEDFHDPQIDTDGYSYAEGQYCVIDQEEEEA
jgi:hypothetical protein